MKNRAILANSFQVQQGEMGDGDGRYRNRGHGIGMAPRIHFPSIFQCQSICQDWTFHENN